MTLVDKIRQYRERRNHEGFLKDNTWEGLVPGNVIEYKGKTYLFGGINPHGGPGMPDEPDPYFFANQKEPYVLYYVRPISNVRLASGVLPMPKAFLETEAPVQVGSTGIYIAFLNPNPGEFKKGGHVAPEDWDKVLERVRNQLKGKQT